jgi:threonine dehydrogenase-like Zn-dependent dehydrogenase
MSDKFERYQSPEAPVPDETWAWNMYGAGVENIGRDGKPERVPVPEPGADQLLVRVDAVGMCYSDVKLIKQGGSHPKLYNRDLATNPTRLGHEATHTVMRVGEALRDQFYPGQRLALQPDIYQQGRSTAYGYTIPGGLIEFHVIGPEVLDADAGSYVIPLEGDIGYAEAALTEPWACVEAAYTQRRRLAPKPGGTMWIVGHPGDSTQYEFTSGLDAPGTVVLTDVPPALLRRVQEEAGDRGAEVVERNGLAPADFQGLSANLTGGAGFDDVVVLDPRSAEMVSEAARLIARRGTFNLVGHEPLDERVQIDVGRIHYDYTAYLGNPGPDIAASYGEEHNRCELRAGGTAVFVGAAGPMGQMHVQRAIELARGPSVVIASDINPERLAALKESFVPLAQERGKRLIAFNPAEAGESLHDLVMRETGGRGADDVVVCVPVAPLMADSAEFMASDGMLVFFAGVPNGTMAPLEMSVVYLQNAQYTGTSGSTMDDQRMVVRKTVAGELSPNRSVAAIGGMEAAQDSVRAMMEGDYPGKIVVFPQITGVPLTGLSELKETMPDVAEHLGPGDVWTREAERELIERYWRP